ncbi:hypothetical protein MEO40_17705 [Dolichospermum sp. ST_sed1]|nr:hypothetical protein [Dolichospermum sp. ST_sed1]
MKNLNRYIKEKGLLKSPINKDLNIFLGIGQDNTSTLHNVLRKRLDELPEEKMERVLRFLQKDKRFKHLPLSFLADAIDYEEVIK